MVLRYGKLCELVFTCYRCVQASRDALGVVTHACVTCGDDAVTTDVFSETGALL